MPLVILTYPLTDGTDIAYGSQVIQNFNDVLAVLNGGIADDNFSGSAKIKGTRISDVVGERIPTTRLEDDSVTQDKLRDDALDANDALRAVGSDHIKNLSVINKKLAAQAVTKDKMTLTAGQRATYPQLEMLVQTVAFSFAAGSGPVLFSVSVFRTTNAGNYRATILTVTGTNNPLDSSGVSHILNTQSNNVNPTTPIPLATQHLLDVYLTDVAIAGPNVTGNVVFVSLSIN